MGNLLSQIRLGQFFANKHLQSVCRTALPIVLGIGLLGAPSAHAQISIVINQPGAGQIVHQDLQIKVQVTSTFEVQGVQGAVQNHSVALVSTGSANQWTNSLSMVGLSYGTNTLTITAIDVFGNSNQVQRAIDYDLPPTMSISSPSFGYVVRTNLPVNVVGADDAPAAPTVALLGYASSTGALTTNIALPDLQVLDLTFRTTDSANQVYQAHRLAYVELSSNLVEVARVSDGEIQDVLPDRILFTSIDNNFGEIGSYNNGTIFRLMSKSRLDGSEEVIHQNTGTNFGQMFLAPHGAIFELAELSPVFFGLYQMQNGIQFRHEYVQPNSSLIVKGDFAAWNGNWAPQQGLRVVNLLSTNVYIVTNTLSFEEFDLAANGDVVFTDADPPHPVYRFRNHANTLLTSDASSSNRYPKTDGDSVCYVKITSTNQMLMLITNGGETQVASGVTIGSDLQINNGWIAYTRNSGSGQMQVWRRSPNGTNTQLTFFGSSSAVAALAPNGEVAIFNGLHLYVSKGAWPPVDIALSTPALYNSLIPTLKPFWQTDRWYATLGGSLFQIYMGVPEIQSVSLTNGVIHLDVMAALGQRGVTQVSSNLVDWVSLATNDITDSGVLKVIDNVSNAPAKFYRLKVQ